MNGKGDCPRPKSVSRDIFEKKWEAAFGKPENKKSSKKKKSKVK